MSQFKEVEVGSVVYFWFAVNSGVGSASDGTTPLYDVREAGATASAAPTASGTPTRLTHANYTDGLHEIAIDTTGYSVGEYAVFCTLTIDSQNPAGFVGSFLVTAVGGSIRSKLGTIETKVDTVDTVVDTINTNVSALNDISTAEVRTQVDAALDANDAELASLPASSTSLRQRLKYLYQYIRFRRTATDTLETIYKDNSSTTLGTTILSDDGTTLDKGKTV